LQIIIQLATTKYVKDLSHLCRQLGKGSEIPYLCCNPIVRFFQGLRRMNLFIGNLMRDVSEADLRELFEPFGKLASVSVVKDKFSGVSKGFAFVEMPEKKEAEAAIAGLHRKPLKGQSMDVTEARPKEQRKPSFGGRGGGGRRRSR
jgi:RNA recognition motif-containing protein